MNRFIQVLETLLIWLASFRRAAPQTLPESESGSAIGRSLEGGGFNDPYILPQKMLERHLYILGATGAGKTNLILKLLEQDLEKGHTVGVVDLRGDLVQRALSICRAKEIDPARVWLLDLREAEYVVGFNPLAGSGEPFVRALHLLDVVGTESPSWGVQLEETLRNALILLAATGHSLIHLERLLLDSAFARRLSGECLDPAVAAFFDRYTALTSEKQLAWSLPIFNKVTPLMATPGLRAVLGSGHPIDLDKILGQRGNILLVSLAVDELQRSGKMLGSLVVSSISRSMFSRVNLPEVRRNPVRLYIDEFETMATDSFEGLIAEGRRFKLSLVLSHQNLAQLPPKLRSAIRNNVGLQALFACGFQDAQELVRELPRGFESDDLVGLRPGELFLMPRGGELIHLQTDLAQAPCPAVELAEYRTRVLREHGLPIKDVIGPRAKVPSPTAQITHTFQPWGLGDDS